MHDNTAETTYKHILKFSNKYGSSFEVLERTSQGLLKDISLAYKKDYLMRMPLVIGIPEHCLVLFSEVLLMRFIFCRRDRVIYSVKGDIE